MLYTAQDTGIKLKLLNALFTGRHCIVNHKMADNTGLEELCHIANNSSQFIKLTEKYWKEPFHEEEKLKRIDFFKDKFNNKNTGIELINAISFTPSESELSIKRAFKPALSKPKRASATFGSLFGFLPF